MLPLLSGFETLRSPRTEGALLIGEPILLPRTERSLISLGRLFDVALKEPLVAEGLFTTLLLGELLLCDILLDDE